MERVIPHKRTSSLFLTISFQFRLNRRTQVLKLDIVIRISHVVLRVCVCMLCCAEGNEVE